MFKVKDLLINILPGEGTGSPEEGIQFGGEACPYSTTIHYMASMASWFANCQQCGLPAVGIGAVKNPSSAGLIATLKAQLTEALGDLHNKQNVAREHLEPQTRDEIEDLERRLTAALDDLQERKKNLK